MGRTDVAFFVFESDEFVIANFTGVRFDAGVESFVAFAAEFPVEGFTTVAAFVEFRGVRLDDLRRDRLAGGRNCGDCPESVLRGRCRDIGGIGGNEGYVRGSLGDRLVDGDRCDVGGGDDETFVFRDDVRLAAVVVRQADTGVEKRNRVRLGDC